MPVTQDALAVGCIQLRDKDAVRGPDVLQLLDVLPDPDGKTGQAGCAQRGGFAHGGAADLLVQHIRLELHKEVVARENQLKLSHDWLCYLAPEIVREMTPGKDEDQLPFSKAADVYAFG